MTEDALAGRRILVVEDEYLIADDLCEALSSAGAEIVGPIPTVSGAIACIAEDQRLDAAVLDVNLRGVMIFPVADALNARGIPFVFATGYDDAAIPERFADAQRLRKPAGTGSVAAALQPLLRVA
jgi:CheY-like chemotaxis protein